MAIYYGLLHGRKGEGASILKWLREGSVEKVKVGSLYN